MFHFAYKISGVSAENSRVFLNRGDPIAMGGSLLSLDDLKLRWSGYDSGVSLFHAISKMTWNSDPGIQPALDRFPRRVNPNLVNQPGGEAYSKSFGIDSEGNICSDACVTKPTPCYLPLKWSGTGEFSKAIAVPNP